MVLWLGISLSKFYDWRKRYGKVNEHNGKIPRDHWLTQQEQQNILDYEKEHPQEGYRRLTFMMLDEDVAAASPATVYRVLQKAQRLGCPAPVNERKGKGFVQPLAAHRHWHIDFSHINVAGTFYHLCSIIDGYSRYLIHGEIRESMTELDAEIVLQAAREKFPGETPRIISDNGSQFVARDFKAFVKQCGMTHVTTSPYYPQSNGKKERFFGTLKRECIRPGVPLSLDDAQGMVQRFFTYYNQQRLHSAIGYVAPADKLMGLEKAIFQQRDQKLEDAREQRRLRRQGAAQGQSDFAAGGIDFAALRKAVSMEHVLKQLGVEENFRGSGPQRRGPCPLHETTDKRHDFSVHLDKGIFQCFAGSCQAQGNVLDFWAAYRKLPLHQAAVDLAEQFQIPRESISKNTNREEEHVKPISN